MQNNKFKNNLPAIRSLDITDYGKLPPQGIELEQAVLGAIMIESSSIYLVIDILKPECFYKDSHVCIFEAICHLFTSGNSIDLLTVTEQLKRVQKLEESGGAYYLSELSNSVASSAHILDHARIVVQKYISRKIIELSNRAIARAYDDIDDPFTQLDEFVGLLDKVTSFRNLKKTTSLYEVTGKVLVQAETIRLSGVELVGKPSGILQLDRVTGGWRDTDLIIVAARPSMGKTAFGVTVAVNAAMLGTPTGFVTLEMEDLQIGTRAISIISGVELLKIRNAKYSPEEFDILDDAYQKTKNIPLYLNDSAAPNLSQLKSIIQRMVSKGCKLIVIDQLLNIAHSEKGRNRADELGTVSRTIKAWCKEEGIPIILLHQLSRAVESRGGEKRPQLSDLRDSGAIEQDADLVLFLHRPEYYNPADESLYGIAEVIIAKFRNGPVGLIPLLFNKTTAKFYDRGVSESFVPKVVVSDDSNNITQILDDLPF